MIQTGREVFFSATYLYMISSGKSASRLIRSFYNPPTITILRNNNCPLYATGTPRLRLRVPQIHDSLIHMQYLNCVWLFVAPWTVAHQAPRSMGFSRQEYWSGLPFPTSGDLPNSRIEPGSPALAGGFLTTPCTIWEVHNFLLPIQIFPLL